MQKRVILFINIIVFTYASFAQTVPAGFSISDVSSGSTWSGPIGSTFTLDGQQLFVWQKNGTVYVCNREANGNYSKQAQAVINIADEVGNWRDFGLVGFALDPNFASNGNIYLLYVVDRHHLRTGGLASNGYNTATNEYFNATIGRVTRYTTTTSGGNLVAVASSRRILLGESMSTGIPILHESHGVGSLAFAADGTLLVTGGDGASYNIEDGGSVSHTYYAQALTDGIIRPAENVGAFRSQMLNSHSGKLLRIDPQTGDGIPSNPFYDAAAPRSAKSRVWALGLRNPFRMSVKPGTGSTNPATGDIGEVFVGEVGWNTWEEQNVVKTPGANFGWPLYEGHTSHNNYMAMETQNLDEPNVFGTCSGRTHFRFKDLLRQDNAAGNKSVYNPCNSSQLIGTHNRYIHARPAIDWQHGGDVARVPKFDASGNATQPTIGTGASGVIGTPFRGNCSAGGIWYTGAGNSFPAAYKNTFIALDYGGTWIKRFTMDFTDVVTRVDAFGSNMGAVVCVTENPLDGSLVVVNISGNTVKKITYGGNQAPVAKLSSNISYGSSPLTVNFTGNTSFDPTPGGSITSYSWNFGGGSPATSTAANPSGIVFTEASGNPRRFVVRLTVTDNGGATNTDSLIISVNNTPPEVNITSPVKNSTYTIGGDVVYNCTATVNDAQHSGSQLLYEWQTILRHNNHEHPEAIDNNVNTTTTISRIGCNGDTYYWMIKLKVTDAAGLSTTDSSKIFPNCNTDNIPPTVTSVVPLSGATNVSTSTNVVANFSEEIDPSTVTGTTFQLRDAGNNLIPATVSTSGNQITLDPSSTLAGSTVYTATITGGASGVKDLAGNALVSNYSWSFTTAAVDNTAPTVTSVSPLSGATGVSTGANIIANFSEAVNASTVTTTTFQLRDAGNNLITATVSTSGNQITLDPTSSLTGSTVYTATITGGASGVKDLAGNALASNYSWSFTTAAASSSYTVFQPESVPAVPSNNDGQSIELGMKFRSTQDGFITGIRYYKGAGTTGTHTGSLWNSTGTRLAQVIFTNETASGWQQALFSNPVAITAGVTYVASYFSPSGDFAVTLPYFTQAVVNGPLRGLAYGEDGPNGLYLYTAASAFPSNYHLTSNYWVDVVFTGSVTDNTPPTVSSVSPLSGATGVSTGANIIANFSEAVNASTVTTTTFQLRDAGNNLITATVSTSGNQITLDPSSTLAGSTVYTATITGGASGVKDLAGNALVSNYSWSFTTAAVDNTPPTVTSVSPLNGATGVSTGANIIANFSEAVNASTVTTTTFQLRDAGNNLIPATVNTSGNQITLDPTSSLTGSTVYTATITGGASGVKDLAGNALVSNYSWSFTTGAVTVQPVTIQSFDTKTGTAATAHSLTGIPAGALLVLATTADAVPSNCAVSSSPALTWTKRVDAAADQSDNAEIWTAVYTAGGSITVTSNWGANNSQVSVCYIVLNAEATLGGASAIGTLQSAPSVTITTTRENSIIFGCTADWRNINGANRTLRDNATERYYFKDGHFAAYHYTKAAPTIAAYTLGVSAPTGQQASTALLEIRGASTQATKPGNTTNSAITVINTQAPAVYDNSLGQNFPNPFEQSTVIPFTLSRTERVNLVLYDINGRIVKVLLNASKDAGKHIVNFNAGSLAKGIYYYRIHAGDFIDVKKLIIW